MAKALDDRSDEELERGLAEDEFGERKAATAAEILRRRREARAEELKRKYKWIGGFLAALTFVLATLKQLWRK
jgi:hypothetical protein